MINKKNSETLLEELCLYLGYKVTEGNITEDCAENILSILAENDTILEHKDNIKKCLSGVLSDDEFDKLYGEYGSFLGKRKEYFKSLKLLPKGYSFLWPILSKSLNEDYNYVDGTSQKIETNRVESIKNEIKNKITVFSELGFNSDDFQNLGDLFYKCNYENILALSNLGVKSSKNFLSLYNLCCNSNTVPLLNKIKYLNILSSGQLKIDLLMGLLKIFNDNIDTNGSEIYKYISELTSYITQDEYNILCDIYSSHREEYYGYSYYIECCILFLNSKGFSGNDIKKFFNNIYHRSQIGDELNNLEILFSKYENISVDDLIPLNETLSTAKPENLKIIIEKYPNIQISELRLLESENIHILKSTNPGNLKIILEKYPNIQIDELNEEDNNCLLRLAKPENLKIIIEKYPNIQINELRLLVNNNTHILNTANPGNLKIILEKYPNIQIDELEEEDIICLLNTAKPENLKIIIEKYPNIQIDELEEEDIICFLSSAKPENLANFFNFFSQFGIDEISEHKYLFCLIGSLPENITFKEKNHKGYLEYFEEIDQTSYDDMKKSKIAEKIVTLTFEQAKNYLELFKMLDDSISMDIQRIKNELIDELLESDDPKNVAKQIINIFERNNLPLTGKIFKVFELLYPKEKFKGTLKPHGSPVLHQYLDEGKNVYDLIYRDLMNIAIKSGDHSLRDYINVFVGTEELLRKFEDLVSSDGFDGNDPDCLKDKLKETEQAELLYLFRKISVLYNRYFGNEINEGSTIEDKKCGESIVADNQLVEFYNEIKKGFRLKNGESIYDRLQRFLWGLGYHSFNEVLKDMDESKKQAHERGLKLYNDAVDNGGKISFPKRAFLKGVREDAFSKIINRGVTCREYLGGGDDGNAAGSDCTPFDIDGIYVNEPTIWTCYGNINLVIDTTKGNIYDTRNLGTKGYTHDKYELFMTLGGNHYGIRTGIPMTEVAYIIYHGNSKQKEFQNICYEIVRNGYYIPVTDNEGNIKFTPEMYHKIRAGFNYMKYYDGFDVNEVEGKYEMSESDNEIHRTDSDEELNALISENSPTNEKYINFAEKNKELAESTIKWITEILENECGIKLNSKFDSSIVGAELYDSGSTGRGTDIPTKDVDLDFTLILDAKDYERVSEIKSIIHERIGTLKNNDHDVQEGGNQIKSKINNIGKSDERPNGVPLDLLILKKSQVIDYSSSDAMKEKLDYIKDNLGEEEYNFVRTNIIIMKKLLKAKGCYKKPEGGMAGIGVENWIIQNHGSFIEALESFEQVAYGGKYGKGKQPISLHEFQVSYPIYDAGENYKDGCNDNFVDKLEENGYFGILEIIKTFRMEGIDGIRNIIKEYETKKADYIN